MQSIREQYQNLRRAYRAASRVSLLAPGSWEVRSSTGDALRKFCGKWDLPVISGRQYQFKFTRSGSLVRQWIVYASCTRFCKSH